MKEVTMQPITGGVLPKSGSANTVKGTGFGEIYNQAISTVNGHQQEAKELVNGLIEGEHSNIHETMIAMEKSSISFKLLSKVQGKVIDAYKEVMRLQL